MENLKILLPGGAEKILGELAAKGHEAYVVGGCVRDSLLGREPKDWDVCTAAKPEEVESVFDGCRIIETGLKHGTVTVVLDDGQYEVTTFRTDGVYLDNRRPESVAFVADVREDLARRDFTVNAMAFHPAVGLVDPFEGLKDLVAGRISCVGNADERFAEDGLRIMRALRFASVYGFAIAPETADAIHRNKHLLRNIAVERVNVELCKLLCGKGAMDILLQYSDVVSVIIPELAACVGFDQNNKYHQFNVYDHIAHAVGNYHGDDVVAKVALLLHDIGKPDCYSEDENGGHFYGHPAVCGDIAEGVVRHLKLDGATQKAVVELVLYHDSEVMPTEKAVRRWLNKIGPEQLMRLMDVQQADAMAHVAGSLAPKVERCKKVREMVQEVLKSEQCFTLKQLAIKGRDLMAIGVPEGRMIGQILRELLREVIEGEASNSHGSLCDRATELLRKPLAEKLQDAQARCSTGNNGMSNAKEHDGIFF